MKQSLQKTGLPSVGLNGTSHSAPHSEQVALCISLGPVSLRNPPPPRLNPPRPPSLGPLSSKFIYFSSYLMAQARQLFVLVDPRHPCNRRPCLIRLCLEA